MYVLFMCVVYGVYGRVLVSVLFCFFFFKQKTAYEMRISDWSSDVCSSDLAPIELRSMREYGPMFVVLDGDKQRAQQYVSIARTMLEIGRASCRERVCQYV